MAAPARECGCDVVVAGHPSRDDLAFDIIQHLEQKGFCTIDTGLDEYACPDAVEEVRRFQAAFRFHTPPKEVIDGLLGRSGSAQICQFMPAEGDDPEENTALQRLDQLATAIGQTLEDYVPALGFEVNRRTAALIHETGSWSDSASKPMTEHDAEQWLQQLVWHRLMALQFLGPGETALELQLFEGAGDTDTFRLDVAPGTLVMLRPDLLSHRASGEAGNIALTCWFLPTGRKAALRGGTLPKLTPAAKLVDDWALERLDQMARAPVSDDSGGVVEDWRVVAAAVFKMDAPRVQVEGGEGLEVAKKGEVLSGVIEVVNGLQWLKVATDVLDGAGFPRPGWVLIDSADSGFGTLIEKVADVSADWLVAREHLYLHKEPVVIKSAACKFNVTHDYDTFFQPNTSGPDFVAEVPFERWNHAAAYAPVEWQDYGKTFVKHGAFMDGIDLFDPKRFSISPAEVKSMDPQQRLALECTDEVLWRGELEKAQIFKSTTGVYVGGDNCEWQCADRFVDPGDMYGCTGGSGAIQANRLSFSLGMMGPSVVLALEGASSLVAIERGYLSFEDQAPRNIRAVSLGLHLMLTPFTWAAMSWRQIMFHGGTHAHGRCNAFDASAAGYVRGEGVGAALLEKFEEADEGESARSRLGLLTGADLMFHTHNRAFVFNSAPALRALIASTCRKSCVDPGAVDAVECTADGTCLTDAVEAVCMARGFRGHGAFGSPLHLTAAKTVDAMCTEATGMSSFLRVLASSSRGAITPTNHLKQLSPYIAAEAAEDSNMQILTEVALCPMRQSITAVHAHSITGTLGMCTLACTTDERRVPLSKPLDEPPEKIAFWPGGGGALENEARPTRGYEIVGSWDGWAASRAMELDEERGGEKIYGCDIALGIDCVERFQILIDGDRKRVLHPPAPTALQLGPVLGPDDANVQHCRWLVDGRAGGSGASAGETDGWEILAIGAGDSALARPDGGAEDAPPVRGKPGDRYRVQLHVAGKWRAVSWKRAGDAAEGAADDMAADDSGRYFVVASWNDWSFEEEMDRDESQPTTLSLEVKLLRAGGRFKIVRNRDWDQSLHPAFGLETTGGQAQGPEEYSHGESWLLGGLAGDVFRVEFQRCYQSGNQIRDVSWRKLRHEALTEGELLSCRTPSYWLVCTADLNVDRRLKMDWDEGRGLCSAQIKVGRAGQEDFQVLEGGDWDLAFSPGTNPVMAWRPLVRGPHPCGQGACWTLGDEASAGDIYEVTLSLWEGRPWKVDWQHLSG